MSTNAAANAATIDTVDILRLARRIGKIQCNDFAKAGKLASKKVTFGPFSRFAVAALHTRDLTDLGVPNKAHFFVWDADEEDLECGGPATIRIAPTLTEAVAGLPR